MRSKDRTHSKLVHYYIREGDSIPNPGREPFYIESEWSKGGTSLHVWFEEDGQ